MLFFSINQVGNGIAECLDWLHNGRVIFDVVWLLTVVILEKGYKTMISQTSEPLQILDSLYQRGYRSNLIDRSLNKIIELERANNLKQASELQTKLQAYELQYQMSSDIFYQRFSEGSLGDDIDYFEWSVFYELWQSVQERLQVLQPKRQ